MRNLAYGILALTLVAVAPLSGQAPVTEASTIDKIIAVSRDSSQVMRHLDHLTNKIGPRLTSSDNLTEACQWAVETFKSFGIENARLYEWGTFPVGFNRGIMTGRMVAPVEMKLDLTTPSWTAGTQGMQSGHVVIAPKNEEELAALGDKLRGAWLVHRQSPRRRRGGGGAGMSEAFQKAGALGEILPGFGQTTDLIITYGSYRISWDDRPSFPRILLRRDQIKTVIEKADAGETVVLEFDIDNRFKKGPIPLFNVIADIPGTEFPDEYVIIGGHIDSWDGATGTTDNGTGTATTIEAARLLMLSGAKPKRTIRFMLWSGEEQGLLGSRAWIKQNGDELAKISAVIVHDGGTNYLSGIFATPHMVEDFDKIFEPVKNLHPDMPFEIRKRAGLPERIGSDHDAFLSAGVPGFFWRQSGKANYTHTHHTQFDTFEAAIPDYQRHSAQVAAIGALGVANLDHMVSRENLTAPSSRQRKRLGLNFDQGMKVTSVIKGGAGDTAGLKIGDKILSIGGKNIKSRSDLQAALAARGNRKAIIFERDGEKKEGTASWQRGGRRGAGQGNRRRNRDAEEKKKKAPLPR